MEVPIIEAEVVDSLEKSLTFAFTLFLIFDNRLDPSSHEDAYLLLIDSEILQAI